MALIVMALAIAATGCLVTSVPDYEPARRTPPFLLDATADPPVTEVLEIKKDPTNPNKYPSVEFSVSLLSEDLQVGVKAYFYTDYGFYDEDAGRPALSSSFVGLTEASTLANGPRTISGQYRPPNNAAPGCHTVTLIVAHDRGPQTAANQFDPPGFDDRTLCPIDASDSDQVTWRYVKCADTNPCLDQVLLDDCAIPAAPRYCPDVLGEEP